MRVLAQKMESTKKKKQHIKNEWEAEGKGWGENVKDTHTCVRTYASRIFFPYTYGEWFVSRKHARERIRARERRTQRETSELERGSE